ncbi:MAG TPA: permease [bacterium]|nr:permease [bacterium]
MNKKEYIKLIYIIIIFLFFYFLPSKTIWFYPALMSGLDLLREYAREHILTCLVPALFIAGAIVTLVKKEAVLKYLGKNVKPIISYSIASVSGALLAICSCTILPLFAGIRKRGAGLGPAITFLFSGPAINIAAIFLTISVLGFNIGIARIISSLLLAIIVGLTMGFIFKEKIDENNLFIEETANKKINKGTIFLFFGSLLSILIINGLSIALGLKYWIMALLVIIISYLSLFNFTKETNKNWLKETWNFSKIILPLLFIGVFIAGFVSPLLPQEFITKIVGSNSVSANLIASIFGAFMYFSTLTEVPIIKELIAKGMSSGPALALLLAGPSLSLPNMLVIRKVLGNKKTLVYVVLVIFYSSLAGLIFGYLN